MSEELKYPIGDFRDPGTVSAEMRAGYIQSIKDLPNLLEAALSGLTEGQMDAEYRPGGWSVRQVVHHVADSHLNAYCRFKLALTEDSPTIKPYDEAAWADLADSEMDVTISLDLIRSLHTRFARLLDSMSDEQYERELKHPETGTWTLSKMLALYAWHSRHHTAHITSLRDRTGW